MNNQIEIPTILVVAVVLILLIAIILCRLNSKFDKKWLWKCLLLFLGIYGLIVGTALILDLYYQIALNEFDLNDNGIFEKNEQINGQQEVYSKVVNNTGSNLSIFTGAIFSSIISLLAFLVGREISKQNR